MWWFLVLLGVLIALAGLAVIGLGVTASVQTITIAAADIPSSAQTLSIELTPGTHTNDGISLLSSYITYTKKSV